MIKTYWVVFMQTEKWWGHLLKRGFSHVCILHKNEHDFWEIFNPGDQKLGNQMVFPFDIEKNKQNHAKNMAKWGYHVIKIEKIEEINRFPKIKWYNRKSNCVTVCRYFMSIGASKILPYSFYKELLRLGKYENWKERYNEGISSIQIIY